MTAERERGRARDAGVSSVEVVLLAPLIVMMILLIVALGVMVNVRSQVAGAARDAARAGSLQGGGGAAAKQAKDAADADLGSRCQGSAKVDSLYVPPVGAGAGGYYRVTVTCTVDMSGFGVFGAHQTFTKTFNAPIDPLQNFVPGDVATTTVAPPSSEPSPTNTQFTAPSWNSPTPPTSPSSTPSTGATPSTGKKTTPPPPTPTGPTKAGH
ncbi:TadE family protein [Catenulispora subtropica]|uniref:TadE-like domain-containing protein n=1 Tax=Catenulispora subtropica TaxID=450798 RepID=A0ABN2TCL5_9ACTN